MYNLPEQPYVEYGGMQQDPNGINMNAAMNGIHANLNQIQNVQNELASHHQQAMDKVEGQIRQIEMEMEQTMLQHAIHLSNADQLPRPMVASMPHPMAHAMAPSMPLQAVPLPFLGQVRTSALLREQRLQLEYANQISIQNAMNPLNKHSKPNNGINMETNLDDLDDLDDLNENIVNSNSNNNYNNNNNVNRNGPGYNNNNNNNNNKHGSISAASVSSHRSQSLNSNQSNNEINTRPKAASLNKWDSVSKLLEQDKNFKKNYNKQNQNRPLTVLEAIILIISTLITWLFYLSVLAYFFDPSNKVEESFFEKAPFTASMYILFLYFNVMFNPIFYKQLRILFDVIEKEDNENEDDENASGIWNVKWVTIRLFFITLWVFLCLLSFLIVASTEIPLIGLPTVGNLLFVGMPAYFFNTLLNGYLLCYRAELFLQANLMVWFILAIIFSFSLLNFALFGFFYLIISFICLMAFLFICVLVKSVIDTRNRAIHSRKVETQIKEKTEKKMKQDLQNLQRMASHSPKGNKSFNGFDNDTGLTTKDYDKQNVTISVEFSKISHVTCCRAIDIPISKFYLIQNICSSFSFWIIFGVSLIANFNYAIVPCIVWTVLCTFYNPMFYQVSSGNVLKSKESRKLFRVFYLLGCVVGSIAILLSVIFLIGNISSNSFNEQVTSGSGVYLQQLIIAFLFVIGGLWYFPATGFLFYRSEIQFVSCHLLSSILCISIPVMIWQQSDSTEIIVGSVGDLLNLDDTPIVIESDGELDGVFIFVTSMVVFATFLAFSGFTCTFYRYRKALIESSAKVTKIKNNKTDSIKEYNLTLTMVSSLLLAFGDVISDFLYAFFNDNFVGYIGYVVRGLFIIQLFVLLCSYWGSLNKMRKDLGVDRKKWPYLHHIKTKTEEIFIAGSFGHCMGLYIIYPIVAILYYSLVFFISLILALTKLIIIKQVHRWWLSWMVVDYNKELKKNKSSNNGNKKRKDSNNDGYNSDSNDNSVPRLMSVDSSKKEKTQIKLEVEYDERYNRIVGKDNKWLGYDVDENSLYWRIVIAIDSLTPFWMLKLKINANLYNILFLTELIVESIPQLILNLANSYYADGLTPVAYLSLGFSGAFLCYSVFKIVYYVGILGYDMKSVVL